MGGYLGFQLYLDYNQEWLLELLRYDEEDEEYEEDLEEIEAEEEGILEEEIEEEEYLDFLDENEEEEEEFDFEETDIDISRSPSFGDLGIGGLGEVSFNLHSVGLDVGMYGPSMSYWNNDFIKDSFVNRSTGNGQTMSKFSTGPLFQGSATFKLGSKLRISLSGGMWSGSAKAENLKVVGSTYTIYADEYDENENLIFGVGGNNTQCTDTGCESYSTIYSNYSMTKDIEVSMVPLTVMLGYEISNGFYVGAGLGTNRVTQKIKDNYLDPDPARDSDGNLILDPATGENTYSSVSNEKEFKGNGSRTILCAGYEIPLGPLEVGVQAQYVLGNYVQEVSDANFASDRDNGTDGISLLVNFGYLFGE